MKRSIKQTDKKKFRLRKYLLVTIHPHDRQPYSQEFQLKEVHFISKLAQENKSLEVSVINCIQSQYDQIFGTTI